MKGLEINGYFTIIENEILDLLLILKLTKHEIKIAFAAVRLLNGFDKEKDRLPLSIFKLVTGMSRGKCSIALNSLIKKKILYRSEGLIGINRDFRQWAGVTESVTGKVLPKWFKWVTDSGKKGVTVSAPSKEKEKETLQRKVFPKIKDEKQRALNLKKIKEFTENLKSIPGKKI